MSAGMLRQRVTFGRQGAGSATYGVTPDGVFAVLFTVWCALKPLRGAERMQAGGLSASHSHTLRVRSSTQAKTITTADNATIDGVAFQIRSISNPDQRGRFLEMLIEEGVAQ